MRFISLSRILRPIFSLRSSTNARSYLYKLTSGNLIPHYKPQGKMLYFEKAELEAWLRQNPVKTQAQIEQEAQKYILNRPLKK